MRMGFTMSVWVFVEKKHFVLFCFVLFVLFFCDAAFSSQQLVTKSTPRPIEAKPSGFFSIVSPKDGDHFVQGQEVTITWSGEEGLSERCYHISLVKDGREVREIAPSVCAVNYQWRIPDDLWGSSFRFKVSTTDLGFSVQSGLFSIRSYRAELTVGFLTVTPDTIKAGEKVTITARIDNAGETKSEPMKAFVTVGSWWDTYASAKKTEYMVPALAFGEHTYITHNEKLPPGDWYIRVIVDKFWMPGTSDYNAETKVARVSVHGPALPDLVVCIYQPLYVSGSVAFIRATVQNIGRMPAGPSKTRIWVERSGSFDLDVPPLKKSETHMVYRSVPLVGSEDLSYRVEVNPDGEVTELSEMNNGITGRIIRKSPDEDSQKTEAVCSDGRHP